MKDGKNFLKVDSDLQRASFVDRTLRVFTDVRPGEGYAGLLLMLNIFLVLASYYLIKPVREGWLAISMVEGLSKIEIKAYSSFGQSLVLLGVIPIYARLARRLSRRALIACVTLFFCANLLVFWMLHPGLITDSIPHLGIAFYLWVGIFSVTVVAQFWSFAADLYSEERGRRLLPLIAVGASAGAVAGSWFTQHFVKLDIRETFDLILVAILPLLLGLGLTWMADKQGARKSGVAVESTESPGPAAPDPTGAFRMVFGHKYILAAALLGLLINWVNTNGENILYGTVQHVLEVQYQSQGITDSAAVARFVKNGTTAFYGNLYFWVNLCGLAMQAFFVSRFLKYGGFAAIIFLAPLVSLLSYSIMALLPVLAVIRLMKIAENSTNYSVNNTARQVLWLPLPASVIYKAKVATDTLFVRAGDGLAALSVLVGTQIIQLPIKSFVILNLLLVSLWAGVAGFIVIENRRLVKNAGLEIYISGAKQSDRDR